MFDTERKLKVSQQMDNGFQRREQLEPGRYRCASAMVLLALMAACSSTEEKHPAGSGGAKPNDPTLGSGGTGDAGSGGAFVGGDGEPNTGGSGGMPSVPGPATSYAPTNQFWLPGIAADAYRGEASAAAWDGKSKLYVAAGQIVVYEGSQRTVLPNSRGFVYAMAAVGNELYIGGSFDSFAGISVNAIARWDGKSWSALGSGIRFQPEGSSAATGWVRAMRAVGDKIYVGGAFNRAGDVEAAGIAVWDTTNQTWSDVGGGVHGGNGFAGSVNSIMADPSGVYLVGAFESAGGAELSVKNIVRWTGSNWDDLTDSEENVPSIMANAELAMAEDVLYAVSGGYSTSVLYKREAGDWKSYPLYDSPLSDFSVSRIAHHRGLLYAAGEGFYGPIGVLYWDGNILAPKLTPIEHRLIDINLHRPQVLQDGEAAQFLPVGNDLYVVGSFDTVMAPTGTQPSSVIHSGGIAVVDESGSWHPVCDEQAQGIGAPFNDALDNLSSHDAVEALAVIENDVYATGAFLSAGCGSYSRIARWDGAEWHALGDGLNGAGLALAVSETNLYVGGNFTTAGGVPANYVARWNGAQWSALSTGANATVAALATAGTDVYIGGDFTTLAGVSAARVARWDGVSAHALGAGLNASVRALVASGSQLYAAGRFTASGDKTLSRIAIWNGSEWSAVGAGFEDEVTAAALVGGKLFVAGKFTTSGTMALPGVAVWDGSSWAGPAASSNLTCNANCALFADAQTVVIVSEQGVWRWDGSSPPHRLMELDVTSADFVRPRAIVGFGSDYFIGGSFHFVEQGDALARDPIRNFFQIAPE